MIRGRFVPQIESTGRPKKCMDILLWGTDWAQQSQRDFDNLEVLRDYLRSIRPSFCGIRVYVPAAHANTIKMLTAMGIKFIPTETREASPDILKKMPDKELGAATQTALACDADVLNRLPNICFTRDRLLFYEMQKRVAERAGWKRQEFNFELSYYLNFYYPLIFGGFDHLALIVNHCLGLGTSRKRNVGATYKGFLDALQAKNPKLHGIFTDPNHVAFMKRVAALRQLRIAQRVSRARENRRCT
jgi:hypothetical protein